MTTAICSRTCRHGFRKHSGCHTGLMRSSDSPPDIDPAGSRHLGPVGRVRAHPPLARDFHISAAWEVFGVLPTGEDQRSRQSARGPEASKTEM